MYEGKTPHADSPAVFRVTDRERLGPRIELTDKRGVTVQGVFTARETLKLAKALAESQGWTIIEKEGA